MADCPWRICGATGLHTHPTLVHPTSDNGRPCDCGSCGWPDPTPRYPTITAETPQPEAFYETRVVSETGGEKGQKMERFDLIPPYPLQEVARVYGRGALKYESRNWERGYAWSLSFAALQRHAWQFWAGESRDSETSAHHLACVIFHAMALIEFERRGIGTDDRSRVEE